MKRLLTSFAMAAVLQAGAQTKPFVKGDRVAVVGNSITEAGYYESYIWLYYMLHYPRMPITIYNCGIGGDRAANILARLEDDVLKRKPTVISLTFGMNDSGYFEYLGSNPDSFANAKVRESYESFVAIERKLKAYTGGRKVMVAGSPYDETVKNPKNLFPGKSKAMERIVAFQQKAAKENGWGYVDFFHPMTIIEQREQGKDSTFTLTGTDRIHPGNMGHFVMAWLFLKAQGLEGQKVADVQIDAARKVVLKQGNCQVTGWAMTGDGGVKYDYLAKALPFPTDTLSRMWGNTQRQSDALKVVPFESGFNQELVQVRGLAAGDHALSIDGKVVGVWPAAEFERGINLATVSATPQYQQAMNVLLLNEERMALEAKLRQYYWLQYDYFMDKKMMYQDDQAAQDSVELKAGKDWAVAMKRDNYRSARFASVRELWQQQMELVVKQIYTVNQPRLHHVEIRRVKK